MEENNSNIHFSSDSIKELQYYVYKLVDPRNGQVFYVGKGSGNRVFDHTNHPNPNNEKEKSRIINEIKSQGLEVISIIHRHHLDEETAKIVEAALIDAYPGLSNIQGGYESSDYGPINAKNVDDIYSREVIDEFDKEDKVLIIKINMNSIDSNGGVYEAVRRWWKVGENTRKEAKQVAAVLDGVIKGVYKINGNWSKAETFDRYEFFGDEIKDSKYLNKRIPDKYRMKGMANPVLKTW